MKHFYFITLLALAVACKQEYVTETYTPTLHKSVKVEEITPVVEARPIKASGKVEANENLSLSFKTGGIIAHIRVKEGQRISKGQTLAQLDLSEINARVTQAQIQVNKLETDLAKYKKLLADSAIAQQVVEDVETALSVAREGLTVAQYNRQHSTITAPSSGTVLSKMAREGELVNPGNPVLIMANTGGSQMLVKVQLSDREVVQLSLGDEASVRFDAYPNTAAKAQVAEIGAQAHPRTGTFTVKLKLIDFDLPLKSGFFAQSIIKPSTAQALLKLPMISLIEGNKNEVSLFTLEENQAKLMKAKPLYIANDHFAIAANNEQSLTIITEGAAYLKNGEVINILN